MALTPEQIIAGRSALATKIQNNQLPEFDRKDRSKAQAHVDAVNDCFDEPVIQLQTETTYSIANITPE